MSYRPVNWRALLDEHRIEFVERGPNVKRGEINIRCPFCGAADPSHHMGLNLDNGWWACWRNGNHRGKSPVRLLMELLRLPYWQARKLAGLEEDFVDPDGFSELAARLLARFKPEDGSIVPPARFLAFPREFAPFLGASSNRFRRYLTDERGFSSPTLLARLYDLRICVSGPMAGRIIIPYKIGGDLVTWTGRAIAPAQIRYKDLDLDTALVPVKETLFNYDVIAEGGEALVIVEGPLDALKIDYYGRRVGVRAVALSTNTVSDEQSHMIREAVGQFRRIYVMMDHPSGYSVIDNMKMRQALAFVPDLLSIKVPLGKKDAGEMSQQEAIEWTRAIVGLDAKLDKTAWQRIN